MGKLMNIISAAMLAAGPGPRPRYIHPAIQKQWGPLLDSLYQVTENAPDSIQSRRFLESPNWLGLYVPEKRALTMTPYQSDQEARHTLIHEFGHMFQFDNQPEFFKWFNPKGEVKTAQRADLERYADAFAEAFTRVAKGDTTNLQPAMHTLTSFMAQRPPFKKTTS
jgi:hypothetical protein